MKIITKKIGDIHPYKYNPRKNDAAVDAVAASIKEFGFKVPIVLDTKNEIIAGHTRLKAAQKLGLKEVPVIIADDLTPEQVKAFRLADNKVAEQAEWNFDLLDVEIAEIQEIDMEQFGFEFDYDVFDQMEEIGWDKKQNEAPMQYNCFENVEIAQFESVGKYDIPVMEPCHITGDKLLRFCDWKETETPEEYIAHFYYDDYKFIAGWRDPYKYLERLKQFKAVISPDFSLYTDFPRVLQILSCYRRQWCGAYWQSLGMEVIPDVVWGDEDSFEFCFDGIPKGGTVAVSTVGVKKNEDWSGSEDGLFIKGYKEMMNRIEPETIIVYGHLIDGLDGNIIRVADYYEDKFKGGK